MANRFSLNTVLNERIKHERLYYKAVENKYNREDGLVRRSVRITEIN